MQFHTKDLQGAHQAKAVYSPIETFITSPDELPRVRTVSVKHTRAMDILARLAGIRLLTVPRSTIR